MPTLTNSQSHADLGFTPDHSDIGFTPEKDTPSFTEQYQKFGEEHPYVSAALSMVPGIGALAPNADETHVGMAKQAGRDLYGVMQGAGPVGMALHFIAEQTGLGKKIQSATEPSNPSQQAGAYATTAAEMAAPLPGAAAKAEELIPSAERAGQKFASVMSSAHDLPINVSGPGDVALRSRELASTGGQMPKVMRDFVSRATDPNQGPITYKEARDFYSNATRLSADEAQRLTPIMKRQAAMFTQALGQSLEDTAAHVGKLGEYQQAMQEYHSAMRIKSLWQDIKDLATSSAGKTAAQALGGGAAGAGAAYGIKELLK